MNSKIVSETTKKLLLNNIPLALLYLFFQTVISFDEYDGFKLHTTVLAVLILIRAVLYALCVAAIVISLYKTFVDDLLLGKSYKYYSLPYKKSKIIFSRAVPAIIIESLMVVIMSGQFSYALADLFQINSQGIVVPIKYFFDNLIEDIVWFTGSFIVAVTIGFLILLAFVISRSFDPSKTVRNLLIAVVIEALANCAVYTIIENISGYLGTKYMFEAQKYPGWTTGEISKVVGLLAYYDAIIQGVVLILLIIELIVSIIASKKLADKRLNVL
ncbi:MAG: hypothetical protein K6A97_04295 [Lachnospiraceae bacterium]|nr:hypothetical protein [Lachnospiraceae bacterium]